MSSASRVPLLVKSKNRKASRISIPPRAKPSNGPRTKHAGQSDSNPLTDSAEKVINVREDPKAIDASSVIPETTIASSSSIGLEVAPPIVKTVAAGETIEKPLVTSSHVAKSIASVTVDSMADTAPSPALKPRRAGGISVGGSFTVKTPVQRHPERLVKITSAAPLYRTSTVMRPRGASIGNTPTLRSQNPIVDKRLRKLDIKPHQSPRRSVLPPREEETGQEEAPASPLMLGGKRVDEEVPDMQVEPQNIEANDDRGGRAKKRRLEKEKCQKISEDPTSETPRRRSLRVKRPTFRETDSSGSASEGEEASRRQGVIPNGLELPEDQMNVYVPARERATMWAKSLLHKEEDRENGKNQVKERSPSSTNTVREKKYSMRKKASNVTVASALLGIGSRMISRSKMEELMKKEPSEMTMGELALTVPKGERVKKHEREEAASDNPLLTDSYVEGSSNLLNVNALKQVRSLAVSSASAAFAGSLVTPQVQLIDGQMVVVENTIKLGNETAEALYDGNLTGGEENTGLPPRHSYARYKSLHPIGPGRRWGKEETKQFYYCLSQVGPNFSMMATLFPTRKRKELKSKFKYEEKNHAKLIEIALRAATAPLDTEMMDVISQMVDKKQQRKRKTSRLEGQGGLDDDITSVASSMALSPMSTPLVHPEEFKVTLNDEELFSPGRSGSFDFSG